MGLPARQRRVLDRIESTLRGSDPRLTALYAIFARLTRDEEMPRIEQLRHTAVLLTWRLRLRMASFLARVFGRLIPRQRAVLFFPLAIALAVVSIVFAAQSSPGKNCIPVTPVAATSQHVSSSKLCRYSDVVTPPYMGR
jgi:hypothetical protein